MTIVAPLTAAQGKSRIVDLVEQLQNAHDEMTSGTEGAERRRDEIALRLKTYLQGAGETRLERREENALIYFLLTGGESQPASRILIAHNKDGANATLIEHVVAYTSGDEAKGADGLLTIDLREATPEIAGVLALGQARILLGKDKALSEAKFLAARILAPGGLIEEIALRQELFVLDKDADASNVERIAHRYSGRFSHSIYAENFFQRLETLSERMWTDANPARRADVVRMFEDLPMSIRIRIGVRIARASLLRGDGDGARQASEALCGMPASEPGLRAVCELYRNMASIFDGAMRDQDEGSFHLTDASLSDTDRLLGECAKIMFDFIRRDNQPPEAPAKGEDTETMREIRGRLAAAGRIVAGAQ
ncbi:MAG: hypothetical protein ACK5JM_03650 [Rhodoblastus sp.]